MKHIVVDRNRNNWREFLSDACNRAVNGDHITVDTYAKAQLARRALNRQGKELVTVGVQV